MALGPALTGAAWGPVRNSKAEQGAEGLLEPRFLEQSVVPGKRGASRGRASLTEREWRAAPGAFAPDSTH